MTTQRASCRICHADIALTTTGVCATHINKYTNERCRGSHKPPIRGLRRQPLDYTESDPDPSDRVIAGMVYAWVGGVGFGLCLGWVWWV